MMKKLLLWSVVAFAVLGLAVFIEASFAPGEFNFASKVPDLTKKITEKIKTAEIAVTGMPGLSQFTSEADFKDYLAKVQQLNTSVAGSQIHALGAAVPGKMMTAEVSAPTVPAPAADRFSTTNVQVFGIDEPDLVKNDGNSIYLSTQRLFPIYYGRPMMGATTIMAPGYPYPNYSGSIKIINALPAKDLKVTGKIANYGDLLLQNNILITLSGNTIFGYDVSDKANPKEQWKIELSDKDSLVGARLYDGKLYVAAAENINFGRPCPYQPMIAKGVGMIIPCNNIYFPVRPVPTDILYTVSSFDPLTGGNLDHISFTGSNGSSVLYMSPTAFYLTYLNPNDEVKFGYDFLAANSDLVPSSVVEKLAKLLAYDISYGSKQNEFYYILNQWQGSLGPDELLKLQSDLQNRMTAYYPLHVHDLERTGIVKTNLSDFKIRGTGEVPGRLLNQYSLDEYENNLRVAVTVGQTWWSIGNVNATTKSVNDVYVLGSDLSKLGEVRDLGSGEQIYAARFIGNRGYVVTFKQTDPFYVIDLTDPKNPSLAGELKLPGYSGYLEPIGDHFVLGVGKEDNSVKVALYDVADAKNPNEVSKYTLNEYWSDALNNPHAFLRDDSHKIFFIPGGQGGYVFSYADNNLKLLKAVSGSGIQRAIYINDVLYMISQSKVTALDENTWDKINELNITEPSPNL